MKTKRQLKQKTSLLRQLRGSLPQYEVAAIIGIDQPLLCLLEQGRRQPSPEVARKLAKFYEVPIERIFP